jgi:spermidine/putrescine ABC transporter ATP-binding subunit
VNDALLSVFGLTVRFGAVTALDALDLSVERGELFVLLGGSGSGKTTLLRAIGGFVRPEAGRVALDGRDLGPLPPHKRPVNTMFQSYALFPHMTVAANIGFGLRQLGLRRRSLASRVAEMLELVQMVGFGGRRPSQLSGGQQQRVALARSLAPRPQLLLLDEPLSALDRNLREQTRQELVALQRRLGITFILVTHDQEEALGAATRIGVMEAGRLAQVGTPAEVYERPRSRFVAEFLGAANILQARLRAHDTDGLLLDVPSARATIRAETRSGAPTSVRDVLLAVRPERIRIGPADAANRVEGVVAELAYAGQRLTIVVSLPDGTLLRAAQSLADGLAANAAMPGETVTLSWHPDACILLPD